MDSSLKRTKCTEKILFTLRSKLLFFVPHFLSSNIGLQIGYSNDVTEIMKYFQDSGITATQKNKKHLTFTFFLSTMKKIIAEDKRNGGQNFVVPKDMEKTNPLVSGKRN